MASGDGPRARPTPSQIPTSPCGGCPIRRDYQMRSLSAATPMIAGPEPATA